ncbi:MAG: DEAD/DEAH box helicase family protein [Vagococcus salmoninarum]|uniref:DEAD/DEAH box helicase family protein n=1 Tax=Vagococcus salmoninarum TaxID=2739 RepID=UPI003F9BAFEE
MEIKNDSELKRLILIWRKYPVIFAKNALGFLLDEWQNNALNSIRDNPLVAIRSGQGVGKTSVEAVIILWFLVCFPNSKVVCTAPTKQQLMDVLWAEVAKWLNNSIIKNILKWTKTKVSMVGEEERWFATARTATKPENMQGFHEDNMLFVVDEASGIAEGIMEAIRGTLSGDNNKLVMMGNPTQTTGTFYEAFHGEAYSWTTLTVSSEDSSRTNKDNIESLKKRYGPDSDVVRVRVKGLFPKGSNDSLIGLELVETAFETEVDAKSINTHNVLHIGVDVARLGNDSTYIAPRILNYYFEAERYEKKRNTEVTAYVLQTIDTYKKTFGSITKVYVKVDETGTGSGVVDTLLENVDQAMWRYGVELIVVPVNNGSRAIDPINYNNLGAQLWADLRDSLIDNMSSFIQGGKGLIRLPKDEVLKSQLTNRKFTFSSSNQLILEKKKDMAKRGARSPDYADAITLAMYEPSLNKVELSDNY